jgi:hypothetical protein
MQSLFVDEKPRPPDRKPRLTFRARWPSPLSDPAPYHVGRWLFLRLLGLIYLCAFVSLWVQLDGLIGSAGVLPAQRLMELASEQLRGRVDVFPTLLWVSASDNALHGMTAAGAVLAVLLVAGIAPAVVLFALWALYLSLSLGGQVFFSFQWDTLLLEAGFLAIWIAPLTMRPRSEGRAVVRRPALWLLWWLLFRLMFESGYVKLASGDPAWTSLTALRYHFETQPLPTWIGWYAHQLPERALWGLTAATFFAELLVPFLIFTTARLRRMACAALVVLQIAILHTGNNGFFNFLTLALCALLLDDSIWPGALRRFAGAEAPTSAAEPVLGKTARSWPLAILLPVSVALFVLSLAPTAASFELRAPAWVSAAYERVQPFRTVNNYGLFAVMTTERPEIIVEGSADGENWLPYEFPYKPGALYRTPLFVAPHQPRLDWQMWFAALGTVEGNPWFLRFVQRLLIGSPDVVALLEENPFPGGPPLTVRATVYDYRFTNPETRAATGNWWRRENPRPYCPAVMLNAEGRLILFETKPRAEPAAGVTEPSAP